jgi:hypothetical protein
MTDIIGNKLTVDFVLAKSKAKDLKSVKKLNCWYDFILFLIKLKVNI